MRPLVEPHLTRLLPYVPGKPIEETEREYGVTNIAKLASNENCLGSSPLAVAAARAALDKSHLYPDAGAFALKARIARFHDVDPKHVVVGAGSNEIITLLGRGLLGKDDVLVNAWPSFVVYRIVGRAQGCVERAVPLTATHAYDLDALAVAINESPVAKLVFLANPNNPTGTCFGQRELDGFLAKIPADVIVVIDEAYAEYVDLPDPVDAIAVVKRRPRTMMLRTMSKAYGLAAFRVGYGVGDVELVQLVEQLRDAFNVSSVAQAAAIAALDDREFVQKSRVHNNTERPRLAAALTELGFIVTPSQTNFLLVTLPESYVFDMPQLNEALLRRALIVRPVANYGLARSFRVTVGTLAENEKLLAALKDIAATKKVTP
jgi:histidinol-phosphate aminotransferase